MTRARRPQPLRWCGTALLLLLVAAAGPAEARRLAIFVGTRDDGLRDFATHAQFSLRNQFSRMEDFELSPPYALLDPTPTEAPRRAVEEATQRVEDALQALRDGEDDRARSLAQAAIKSIEGNIAGLEQPLPLAQAYQAEGASWLRGGDRKQAIQRLSRAMALAPSATLDPALFGREAAELYAQGLAKAKATGGTLRVESDPPGAAVMVDGTCVGVTPLDTKVTVQGRHLVRIEQDGYQPEAALLLVRPGPATELKRSLRPLRQSKAFLNLVGGALEQAGIEELAADEPTLDLGTAMEAQELVLVRVLATRERQVVLEGYHYDFLDGQLINVGDRLFAPDSATLDADLRSFVDDLIGARTELSLAGTIRLKEPPPGASYVAGARSSSAAADDEPSGEGGLLRSPWLWAGVGGAAAAAGGVAALILLSGDGDGDGGEARREGRLLFGFE